MAKAIETTQQIVLSVRIRGDGGPQTGDVVLDSAFIPDFEESESYAKNSVIYYKNALWRAKEFVDAGPWEEHEWEEITEINFRLNDFIPEHTYTKNEVCVDGGRLFRAIQDFESGATFNPADWEQIDTVDVVLQDFKGATDYKQFQAVIYQGKIYRAKAKFTSLATFNPNDWELLADITLDDFIPNHDYNKNNMIVVGGNIYRANEDFTSGSTWNYQNWTKIGSVTVGEFSPNMYYPAGSLILNNGKLYTAKVNFTSGPSFVDSDWTIVSDTVAENWNINTFYEKNHIVTHNGHIYRARNAHTSGGAWDITMWEDIAPTIINPFAPNTTYNQDTVVSYNGGLYIAINNFTSGATFNPDDWQSIGTSSLQQVFETSSGGFTGESVATVTSDEKDFTERITDYQTIYQLIRQIITNTNEQLIVNGIDLADFTGAIEGYTDGTTKDVYLKFLGVPDKDDQFANLKIGVRQANPTSYPFPYLSIEDAQGEKMIIEINEASSSVTLTENIRNALTEALRKASTADFGTVKVDGTTIVASNGVISSVTTVYEFITNTKYNQGQMIVFNNSLYKAKNDFTSGTAFDIDDWDALDRYDVVYEMDNYYPTGYLVYGTIGQRTGFWVSNKVIENSPAGMDQADWDKFDITANGVQYSNAGTILDAGTVQEAITELAGRADSEALREFVANKYYAKGTPVIYENKLYTAKATFTAGASFNIADWQIVSDIVVDDYKNNTYYEKGHVVSYTSSLWRAADTFTSGSAWDPTKWVSCSRFYQVYIAGLFYPVNFVAYGTIGSETGFWRANKNILNSPATMNSADWVAMRPNATNITFSNSGTYMTATNTQAALSELSLRVKPHNGSTRYLFRTAVVGSAAPAAVAGHTIITLYTES